MNGGIVSCFCFVMKPMDKDTCSRKIIKSLLNISMFVTMYYQRRYSLSLNCVRCIIKEEKKMFVTGQLF